MTHQDKPAAPAAQPRKDNGNPPAPAPGSHNDGKEYGTAKRPAGGAHADPHGKHRPG